MVVTKMESSWNQRYEDLKERYEEFCENRVNLMSNYMSQCMKKKRKVDTSSHPSQPDELERATFELKEKDDGINSLQESNQRLNEVIVKLKNSLKVVDSHFLIICKYYLMLYMAITIQLTNLIFFFLLFKYLNFFWFTFCTVHWNSSLFIFTCLVSFNIFATG